MPPRAEAVVAELGSPQRLDMRFELPPAALLVGEQAVVVLALDVGGGGGGGGKDEEARGGGFGAAALRLGGGELFPGGRSGGALPLFRAWRARW